MEDSFAERMRKRAMERLERNAHIVDEDSDFNCPSVAKKLKSPLIEPEKNKENLEDNLSSDFTKPVIAEHLTVRKSLSIEKMDCDEPGAFILRSRRKAVLFPEDEFSVEKKEDVYVKHCKNRLGTLANKFKTFEEEDSNTPLRPVSIQKQTTVKRRSKDNLITYDISGCKTAKCASKYTPMEESTKRPEVTKEVNTTSNSLLKGTKSPKKPVLSVEKNVPQKVFDASVVETLESQGYKRTTSDGHLYYDFKTAKEKFNKENMNVNPVPKPKRHFDAVNKQSNKSEPKEISKLFSNSKFQNNVFIQNSKKPNEIVNENPDPCLLSVAERKKLFEKRLRGEIDTLADNPITKIPTSLPSNENTASSVSDEYHSGDDFRECENESNSGSELTDYEVAGSSQSPTSDGDISSENELEGKEDKEADLSAYPVLQTVRQVKFASTPKPGRLYPSMSDLDGEVEEVIDTSKIENDNKVSNFEDSFCREVLCATNSMFSSFQNSRKDTSEVEERKTDALNEVKELISPNEDISLSFSTTGHSSIASVECPNETASFTFMKTFSNYPIDGSSFNSKNTDTQSEIEYEDNGDVNTSGNDELDVKKKIRSLEEMIVKEKMKLAQEIRALKYCLSTSFMNTTSHLAAEKFVLLSQLKIQEAEKEIQRIKVENSVQPVSAQHTVRGNVIISNIRLPIKTAVVRANLKEDIENNLMCIVKCGETVLATEVVPVVQNKIKQDIDGNYIEFPDKITVPDVTSNFKIRVEVYNLTIEKKELLHPKGKNKDKKKSKKDKKELFGQYFEGRKTPHSSFIMVGYMLFSQDLAQRHQWMLNKHHLPLVGMIMMDLKFNLAKITVQKHGFLTMYEIISGYGAWSRYWFFLNGDKLLFWKYPEQEAVQEPINTFDLKKCITKNVVVVGYDIVFRPQTFILKFDPPTYLQQFKGLTEDRLLLSADTEEERISWCESLNEVLKSVRSWSSPSE